MSIALMAFGLSSVIEGMGWWFDWIRPAGAAYLVWLGWKLIRAGGACLIGGGLWLAFSRSR